MPPVSRFGEVLESLIEQNREAGRGIRSWRQLHKKLHELDPDKQSAESWKRSTNRYRGEDAPEPEEATIALYATALSEPVSSFPSPVPRAGRAARLELRLAELAAVVEEQGKEMTKGLRTLAKEVRALRRERDDEDPPATQAQADL